MAGIRKRREAAAAAAAQQALGNSKGSSLTDPDENTYRMPDPDDPAVREALRKRLLERVRGGRLGTILSDELRNRMGQGRTL